ncbi:MAG: hypothetical protein ABIH83_01710 [Candidatus Micrarchaeota archaeon]
MNIDIINAKKVVLLEIDNIIKKYKINAKNLMLLVEQLADEKEQGWIKEMLKSIDGEHLMLSDGKYNHGVNRKLEKINEYLTAGDFRVFIFIDIFGPYLDWNLIAKAYKKHWLIAKETVYNESI